MQKDIVIRTHGLTKRFKTARRNILAVDNLSIEVPKGSIYGFLGPNGSGKTTTIGMLLGLIRPSSGSIELFGQDLSSEGSALLKRASSVLENSPTYPYLSGRDNLEVYSRMRGVVDRQKINKVLDVVGLTKRADSLSKTYSLGMRQRLTIALALLSDPDLVILDEPSNGLDPSGIIDTRNLIRKLGAQGKTIFLSSHLLHEVEQVCDYVAVLDRGRVIAQGPVDELLHRGKTLALKVNDINAASSLLNQVEWISTIETDDEYLYVTADEEKHPDINEMLVQSGIRVFEMKKFSDSLEDFFLDVIEEDREGCANV
ncbi:MAG: ABC transporter ATP-binding protein [Dehalococcoidales bacterium]|nr:ABC transporter ATP-binding protein [Dehalococcoidales bacterium]